MSSGASNGDRSLRPARIAAELGVLCAGLGAAASCCRLFVGWDFMATLGPAVAISWAVVVLTRRARLGVATSAAISAAVAILVLTWMYAPDTVLVGLPTPDTARQIATEMRASFSEFSELVAPVEASEGFLVTLAAVLWAFTWFADTAAFRYRGPVQAVVPFISVFVAVGVLSRSSGRTAAAVCFGAGITVYAVTQRVLLVSRQRWAGGSSRRGTRSVAVTASVVVATALGVGLLLGPVLPGDTDAVVDLRSMGRQSGPRTVVSPFVGVRSLLGPQSDQVVFTVRSPVASYWRLTSLGRYDAGRDIWVSQGTYQEVHDGRLDGPSTTAPIDRVEQSVEIAGLGGPWLPAAFVPRSIDADLDVSFDAATSSIITDGEDLATGDRYRIASDIPLVTPTDLNASRREVEVAAAYLDTTGVSSEVARRARRATLGQTTPYQQALALQNWFRDGFEYDTGVDYRDAADPVAAFLDERRGFCQQFASAYALMARSVGLPARVAVGFTPGDAVESSPTTTTYVVRGRHAHTWPEVHFDGVGWVPFEPTTQRGNPVAVDYTGVAPQQAEPPAGATTTTSTTTTTTVTDDATSTTVASGQVDAVAAPAEQGDGGDAPALRRRWLPILAMTAAAALAAVAIRRRRRHGTARRGGADGPVAAAWTRAVSDLSALGFRPTRSETPLELADRVAATAPFDRPPRQRPTIAVEEGSAEPDPAELRTALARLARLETERRWGRSTLGPDAERDAEAAAEQVRRITRSMRSRRPAGDPVGAGSR